MCPTITLLPPLSLFTHSHIMHLPPGLLFLTENTIMNKKKQKTTRSTHPPTTNCVSPESFFLAISFFRLIKNVTVRDLWYASHETVHFFFFSGFTAVGDSVLQTVVLILSDNLPIEGPDCQTFQRYPIVQTTQNSSKNRRSVKQTSTNMQRPIFLIQFFAPVRHQMEWCNYENCFRHRRGGDEDTKKLKKMFKFQLFTCWYRFLFQSGVAGRQTVKLNSRLRLFFRFKIPKSAAHC